MLFCVDIFHVNISKQCNSMIENNVHESILTGCVSIFLPRRAPYTRVQLIRRVDKGYQCYHVRAGGDRVRWGWYRLPRPPAACRLATGRSRPAAAAPAVGKRLLRTHFRFSYDFPVFSFSDDVCIEFSLVIVTQFDFIYLLFTDVINFQWRSLQLSH